MSLFCSTTDAAAPADSAVDVAPYHPPPRTTYNCYMSGEHCTIADEPDSLSPWVFFHTTHARLISVSTRVRSPEQPTCIDSYSFEEYHWWDVQHPPAARVEVAAAATDYVATDAHTLTLARLPDDIVCIVFCVRGCRLQT